MCLSKICTIRLLRFPNCADPLGHRTQTVHARRSGPSSHVLLRRHEVAARYCHPSWNGRATRACPVFCCCYGSGCWRCSSDVFRNSATASCLTEMVWLPRPGPGRDYDHFPRDSDCCEFHCSSTRSQQRVPQRVCRQANRPHERSMMPQGYDDTCLAYRLFL